MKFLFYLGVILILLGPTVWWLAHAPWQTAVAYSVTGLILGAIGDPNVESPEEK